MRFSLVPCCSVRAVFVIFDPCEEVLRDRLTVSGSKKFFPGLPGADLCNCLLAAYL